MQEFTDDQILTYVQNEFSNLDQIILDFANTECGQSIFTPSDVNKLQDTYDQGA